MFNFCPNVHCYNIPYNAISINSFHGLWNVLLFCKMQRNSPLWCNAHCLFTLQSTVWVKTEVRWVMCHIQVTCGHRLKCCFMWLHHQIVGHTFGNEAGVGTLNFGCHLAVKIRHRSKWQKASGNPECISITDYNSYTVQSARALHGKNMNSMYSLSQKYLDIPCYFHQQFLSLHLESFRI